MCYTVSMSIPQAVFTAPIGDMFKMEVESVDASTPVIVVRNRRTKAAIVKDLTEWSDLAAGTIVRITRAGEKPFYFKLASVDPTGKQSRFAWLRGHVATAGGKLIEQIDHAHLPEGQRQELVEMAMVTIR